MKINLQEKLTQEKKKDMEVMDSVKEVRLLLAGDESEDARILRNLSQNSELNRVEKITQTALEIEKLESSYTGNVFTLEQIKKLAIDYRLRFLNSQYFTGKFDVEVAAKIKEFSKENNISLNEYQLKNCFFILGPKEVFNLKEVKYIEPRPIDPILFYRIDESHYRLIHKWGSDFTVFRYLEGYKWKNIWNYFWFKMFALFPVFAFFVGLVTSLPWATLSVGSMLLIVLSVVAPTSIFVFFRHINSVTDSEWDAIFGFFTEGNWNSDKKLTR